jgi:hypothetical protein
LKRWEAQVDEKLLNGRNESEEFSSHDKNGLLSMNSAARSAFYSAQFMIGALSQNDIREMEDQNPIGPGGNIYYVPLNMRDSSKDPEEEKDPRLLSPAEPEGPEDGSAPDAGPPVPDGDKEEKPKNTNTADILRPIVMDAVSRMAKRECSALARATKKYRGENLEAWRQEFYESGLRVLREAFRPAAEVACTLTNSGVDPAEVVNVLVGAHISGWSDEAATPARVNSETYSLVCLAIGATHGQEEQG